jgi:hypothetical protein
MRSELIREEVSSLASEYLQRLKALHRVGIEAILQRGEIFIEAQAAQSWKRSA